MNTNQPVPAVRQIKYKLIQLNAAPSQSPHDFEIASLQRMALAQNSHRTGEVAEMGSL